MVQPGTVLAGKYQVERILGQGGMGIVVSAFHLQLGQRVAIKFLLPEALRIREAVERFLREARAAVRLRSEHVGRVIDVGQFDDGSPYMVMEYLEGIDLSGYLQRQGVVPVPHAVDFVLQACEAIAEAHSVGIVHRDLKPANLFLTRGADGSPLIKVLDFGISKAAQSEGSFNLTRTTSVMGSPGYMSPEQLRSTKDCDARSDIWALGVILYELTVGRTPFGGESITELALKVAMDPTPAMNLPGSPVGFEHAVHRCLAKDPAKRFQNVAELGAELAAFGPAGSTERAMRVARVLHVNPSSLSFARPDSVMGGGGKPTTLSSAASTYGDGAPPKRRTGLIAGVAVAVALAGGIAVAVAMKSGKRGTGSAAEPAAATQPKPEDDKPAPVAVPKPAEPKKIEAPPPVVTPDAGVAAVVVVPVEPPVETKVAVPVAAPAPTKAAVKKKTTTTKRKRPAKKTTGASTGGGDDDLSDSRY